MGCILEVALLLVKTLELNEFDPYGLIPAVVRVMSVWFVNACNFMKFVEWCLFPRVIHI